VPSSGAEGGIWHGAAGSPRRGG
jgi:hypothetical protein